MFIDGLAQVTGIRKRADDAMSGSRSLVMRERRD
jgi:hypothetical protein